MLNVEYSWLCAWGGGKIELIFSFVGVDLSGFHEKIYSALYYLRKNCEYWSEDAGLEDSSMCHLGGSIKYHC